MADRINDCVKRYGIDHKIMAICLDNAANNNTLVVWLEQLIENFRGPSDRSCCAAHIVNLMAKAFLVLYTTPTHRARGATSASSQPAQPASDDPNEPGLDLQDSADDVDPDKLEHDIGVTQGVAADAIAIMADSGMHLDPDEVATAQQILPKVAGLAQRVNDSPVLTKAFEELVDKDPDLQGDMKSLPCRVATRWNTERVCLRGHLHFKTPVQWLTSNPRTKLKKYALTDDQWELGAELCDVLEVFQELTDCFSRAEVPLVHETIPKMLTLRSRLSDIRDDILSRSLHRITRVAAEAALQVFSKYMGLMEDSDVYILSVDRKLKWFADRGFVTNQIRQRVVNRFKSLYPHDHPNSLSQPRSSTGGSIWTQCHSSSAAPPMHLERDSIEEYLETPVISNYMINQHGGVLLYWSSELERCPRVARMALDLLTMPEGG
ncbi:hypothetical protein FRC10_002950 [Ceratobasidium sp. 414]|nr:hypothetical protein FRC10_002950 [Ceratobasidium sp. 414]